MFEMSLTQAYIFLILSLNFLLYFCQQLKVLNDSSNFICGGSKFMLKCGCYQESDGLLNIPLFNVDCSRLDISDFPSNDVLPLLIGQLDVSHNLIESLNDSTYLSKQTLHHLDLSYNKLKYISDGFFSNSSELVTLDLSHNYLQNINQDLFMGLVSLRTLNLKSNKLTTLPQDVFRHLFVLENLILSYNDIGNFIMDIKMVNLIVPMSVKVLELEHVNLKNMTNVTFEGLENITSLMLARNPIDDMAYLDLENIEILDLSDTRLSIISPKILNYKSLRILKLRHLKELTNISDFTFYNLQSLHTLLIEDCEKLEELNPLAFGYLRSNNVTQKFSLRHLSLAHNNLTNLKESLSFLFETVQSVNLQGNPWNCDCNLKWILKLKYNMQSYNNIRCSSPSNLQNKTMMELSDADFCNFEETNEEYSVSQLKQWSFPIIGILTIIVLVLVGLLIYLSPREKRKKLIGPDSPYNVKTILISDART